MSYINPHHLSFFRCRKSPHRRNVCNRNKNNYIYSRTPLYECIENVVLILVQIGPCSFERYVNLQATTTFGPINVET